MRNIGTVENQTKIELLYAHPGKQPVKREDLAAEIISYSPKQRA